MQLPKLLDLIEIFLVFSGLILEQKRPLKADVRQGAYARNNCEAQAFEPVAGMSEFLGRPLLFWEVTLLSGQNLLRSWFDCLKMGDVRLEPDIS
jgi:hypothetical protein